jgi:hypothetical protein
MAVYVAYSLAIQAVMASVGLAMSVGAASDQAGLVLCSFASSQTADALGGHQHKPAPAPQCPFCFVAGQSAGHVATAGEAPAFLAHAPILIAAISHTIGDATFAPQFHYRQGESRAPPASSV